MVARAFSPDRDRDSIMIDRRTLLTALPALPTAALLEPAGARAEAPMTDAQVPAIYRTRLGETEITAISDGYIPFTAEIIQGALPETVAAALAGSVQASPLTGDVNCYVVNGGGRLCLIDAGGPSSFIPTLGRLPTGLAAAGIDAAAIDQVLLTHLHVDHIGGLTHADGSATFPQATLTMLAAEHAFWTDPGLLATAPDGFRPLVTAALAAVAAYADRLVLVDDETEVAPGITTLPIPGHTPGMTGYRIASGDRQMLMWADVLHVPAVQFAHPDWRLTFDADGDAAARSRARIFDMTATDHIPVLGSHLPFPGHGHVTRAGGAHAYEAAWWDHFV